MIKIVITIGNVVHFIKIYEMCGWYQNKYEMYGCELYRPVNSPVQPGLLHRASTFVIDKGVHVYNNISMQIDINAKHAGSW